ncbi:M15 family metallopeptidase [bacterium]|nr:M15 family metallopeptidase [bacterium]
MKGVSFYESCPVPLSDLRIVNIKHLGFDDNIYFGDLIVHKDVAFEVSLIFKELFEIKYPIKKIMPIEKYNGDDFESIEADNTSAFNCRKAEGSNKYSKHSYGKALDINPIENPYVYKNGTTSHKGSIKYLTREKNNKSNENKAVLTSSSKAVLIFKKYGWKWGGDWKNTKDYQHFQK